MTAATTAPSVTIDQRATGKVTALGIRSEPPRDSSRVVGKPSVTGLGKGCPSSGHNAERLLICKGVLRPSRLPNDWRCSPARERLTKSFILPRKREKMISTLGLPPSRGLRAFDGNHTHMSSRQVSSG